MKKRDSVRKVKIMNENRLRSVKGEGDGCVRRNFSGKHE